MRALLPWPQSAFPASPVDLVGSPAGAAAPQTTVPASGTPCAVDTLLATCRRLLADLSTSDAGELAERICFLLRNECQAPGCYRDAIATLVMELFTGFTYIPRVKDVVGQLRGFIPTLLMLATDAATARAHARIARSEPPALVPPTAFALAGGGVGLAWHLGQRSARTNWTSRRQ